jgi:hypothetical protein
VRGTGVLSLTDKYLCMGVKYIFVLLYLKIFEKNDIIGFKNQLPNSIVVKNLHVNLY